MTPNEYREYYEEYLIKAIFGDLAKKKNYRNIVTIILCALRNNDIDSYLEARDWFAAREYFDWANHFSRIAFGIERQRENLYKRKNVYC